MIQTSKPENIGKIQFVHTKVIRQLDENTTKNTNKIVTNLNGVYSTYENEDLKEIENFKINRVTSKVDLKETTTKASLSINKNGLSTQTENADVEMRITLETDNEAYDLYKNPKLEIELPEEITEVQVKSINKLYGDEFKFKKAILEKREGKNVIVLELEGEQLEFQNSNISKGTTIVILTNMKINNFIPTMEKNVRLSYWNEKAKRYENNLEYGISEKTIKLNSPKEVMVSNEIETYELQEKEGQDIATLEMAQKEKKTNVNLTILNNIQDTMKQVSIIGNLPTKGENTSNKEIVQNTMDINLTKAVTLNSENAKIYYTNNENADADLTNAENGWTEQVNSASDYKKYLVQLGTDLQQNEQTTLTYGIEIPEGLGYNQVANLDYSVVYQEGSTLRTNTKSSKLKIATETQSDLEVSMKAKIGDKEINNNDSVHEKEIITYTVSMTNTGTLEDITANIEIPVPEGTTYIEKNVIDKIFVTDPTKKKVEFLNIIIPAGKTIEKEIKVEVNSLSDSSEEGTISNSAKVTYNGNEKNTQSISNVVKKAKIQLELMNLDDEDKKTYDGGILSYNLKVTNLSGEKLENVTVQFDFPDDLENPNLIEEQYIDTIEGNDYEAAGIKTGKLENGILKYTMDEIQANGNKTLRLTAKVKAFDQGINEKQIQLSSFVELDNEKYYSIDDVVKVNSNNFEVQANSDTQTAYLKVGDIFNYSIKVTNKNNEERTFFIEDKISENLEIKKIVQKDKSGKKELDLPTTSVEDEDGTAIKSNLFMENITIPEGETVEFVIQVEVLERTYAGGETIENVAIIESNNKKVESQVIKHIMEKYPVDSEIPENPDEPENPNNPSEPSNPGNSDGDNEDAFMISGQVWKDENSNGQKDNDEERFKDVKVALFDGMENIIETTTNDNGEYSFKNIKKGEYVVVFYYDSNKFTVTEYQKENVSYNKNNDAIEGTINDEDVAITDSITIEDSSQSDIDLGLVEREKFDLSLKKQVARIEVDYQNENIVYSYNNTTLAKVELNRKKLENAIVTIVYEIIVRNEGELSGTVDEIVDNLSNNLIFDEDLNEDWYMEDGKLYSNALEEETIEPGESKKLEIYLTMEVDEDNLGLINNTAEITQAYNDFDVEDIDSTPGNNNPKEDDFGNCDIILSIGTGRMILYTSLIIAVIALLGVGIYFINKKVIRKGDKYV